MSSSASEARDTAGGRLGGARADFVASLGRKVSDARELLLALEEDPSSKPARDELRRRLHALGSGARLLRFEAMARSLQEVLAVLDRGAQAGHLREQEIGFLAQVLDDLPALAWGEPPPREAAPSVTEETEEAPALPPISVLVVGGEALADALTEEAVVRSRAFECERTEDAQAALQLARAYAPDLVLIDADDDRAYALVEALLDDPLTEPVPVVVIGSFRAPDEASRFVALGVAKTLARPVGDDLIRHACDEVLDAREGRTVRMTLGEPTLEQLADRLSQELRSALVASVDPTGRSYRVPLGEGTEVLGALWGAIARVQEIVSQKTKGAIRFGGDTPEGGIALAPWLHQELPGADRLGGRGRGAAADVRLNGRRVVVADDDPGVTWFISDLLRTAGCEVHEALDGTTALHLAYRVQPELVVSDILMPGLDGFALCRALKRDVALRDTPVMLLSWKEDLLQRVRELGASAAAYMRKESDSRAVLARVREVLRPRARIETRMRGDGEVRGRLDDLSPRLLLELVCTIRKDARVAVRDATFLYEIEIRDGAPRKATRTASDGSFQSGERALAMLLAVGAGRFVVASSSEAIRGELTGTLFEQLARPLAAARGALASTTGARTMEVERILLDASVLEEYLRATPDPARTVLKRLAAGASPRQMLLAGETSPSLVEDLLSDLAARCAIRAVEAADGTDLLTPAVEAALGVLTGAVPARRTVPPNARPSVPPRPPVVLPARSAARVAERAAERAPEHPAERAAERAPEGAAEWVPERPAERPADRAPEKAAARFSDPAPELVLGWASIPAPQPTPQATPMRPSPRPPAPYLARANSEPPPPPRDPDEDNDAPSSLEDAVMREISDRTPDPGPVQGKSKSALQGLQGGHDLPPIVEPSQLRPRSSNPPANREEMVEAADEPGLLPSIPPDAIVPAATSNEEFAVVPAIFGDPAGSAQGEEAFQLTSERRLVVREPSPIPESPREAHSERDARTEREERELRELHGEREEREEREAPEEREALEARDEPLEEFVAPLGAALPAMTSLPPEDLHEVPEESIPAPPSSSSSRWGFLLAFAMLAGVVVTVLRMASREAPASRAPEGTGPTSTAASTAGPATTTTTSPAGATSPITGSNATAASDDLPPGASVPFGYGVLEIAAPPSARVRIDGAEAGSGPLSSSVQRAGYHQVRIDQDGKNSQYVIEVRAGKTTRVKSSPLP